MLALVFALDFARIEWYLSYADSADTAILQALAREYPSLRPYTEFLKQRDFRKFNIGHLIHLGTPRPLVSSILSLMLEDLYDRSRYRQVVDTFAKYRKYAGERSRYYYVMSLKKMGNPLYRKEAVAFINKYPSSPFSYRLMNDLHLNLSARTRLRVLYHNRHYREIIRSFPLNRQTAFYVMSSYYKLRMRDRSYSICRKYTDILDWSYYLRCAISSESAGDIDLAVKYIKRLHAHKPDKASRLFAWLVLEDPSLYDEFMSLKDSHDETLFLKAMLSLRSGDTTLAMNYLRAIANGSNNSFERSRAYFWMMKLTGHEAFADSTAKVHPYGYYAARLGIAPPILDSVCIDTTSLDGAVPVLMLEAFGLRKYAYRLVNSRNRAGASYLLARFGYYPLSIYLASSLLRGKACRDVFSLAFPLPFRSYFEEASDSSGVPASLLYAIAREESRFDTMAVSIAGARGMLQMMPFQFRKQRRKLGLPDRPFEVRTNLMAGAHHFAEELKDFSGDYELTICAYNAGRGPVRRWVDVIGLQDRDFFFEMIPYRETRNYFRRVFRSWKFYNRVLANN